MPMPTQLTKFHYANQSTFTNAPFRDLAGAAKIVIMTHEP
jgi:hypothetical protein